MLRLFHGERETLALKLIIDWCPDEFLVHSVVDHEPQGNLVVYPVYLAVLLSGLGASVCEMANEMLVLFEICLNVDSEFAWVSRLFHANAEAIEVLIVDLEQIDTLKPTKHVWHLHKACLISHKCTLQLD